MAAADFHDANVRLYSKADGAWFVHPDLRAKLVADAKEQNTNLTDVALVVLHRRFGLTYVPNGRSTTPGEEREFIRLRLPLPLHDALKAVPGSGSYVDVIRQILCAHYGLRVPAKPRRTRRRRALAA